jgi:hypothetical protein
LRQDEIIDKLEKTFKGDVATVRNCSTPMSPQYTIIRPKDETDKISAVDQQKYRSGVGSLNYLVKHTRPDLSNSVRELSKVLDGATYAHLQDMFRAVKYVLDTREYGIPLMPLYETPTPTTDWLIEAYTDSDYSGDRDNRHSVTGYEIYVNKVLIAYKSRLQKTVTLSSCEAEYIALAETCSEILYVKQILESMGITIHYPIVVYVDNIGAMFLANNETSTRTKHIDVRHHFVRELVEGPNPIVQLVFVRSEKNRADPYTKNVSVGAFRKAFLEDTLRKC